MFFTALGLVSATLFGVFFGSEGTLPPDLQDLIFVSLILAGVSLHALKILYESSCSHFHWHFCHHA